MPKSWWYKFILIVVFTIVSIFNIIPTLFPHLDLKHFPVKERVNLGLDLQGGLYIIMGLDFPTVFKENLNRNYDSLKNTAAKDGILVQKMTVVEGTSPLDPQLRVELQDATKVEAFRKLIKERFSVLRIEEQSGNLFRIGFTHEQLQYVQEHTVEQSIEVIRNRIDEFGISEPVITSQGNDKVVVELPGVQDVEHAKSLIGQTAKLEFRIVDDKTKNPGELRALVSSLEELNKAKFPEDLKLSTRIKLINELAKGKIPDDVEIAFERMKNQFGKTTNELIPYLLKKKTDVTGDDLKDAYVGTDPQTNLPEVALSFNYSGTAKFDQLTGENVGNRIAIVLDGVVHTAPVVNGRIPNGSARITLGSAGNYNDTMREARDIALVLRAGALPAQLEILEQRTVGPTLGQDSIRKGSFAGMLGCIVIFLFMIFYYRFSGVIATVSLILNLIFCFALLVMMGATLTLPGIAGLALVIGMGVDSNVIIFERIRDELAEGVSINHAVERGFSRAFRAIFDANITHGIVGLVLFQFGTGPLKGFAVTLLIGIFTTLFCAVTICKAMFEFYLKQRPQSLSI